MNIANKLTLFRVFLVPVFIIVFNLDFENSNIIAAIIFSIAAFTDFLDGYLARKHNLVTNFGKFADPLADKILTSAAFILLVGSGDIPAWIVVIIIAREFIISGFRIIAASEGVTIAASWWGKFKTIFQLLALIFILIENFPFNIINLPVDRILLYLALIFTVISGIDYIYKNIHTLKLEDI